MSEVKRHVGGNIHIDSLTCFFVLLFLCRRNDTCLTAGYDLKLFSESRMVRWSSLKRSLKAWGSQGHMGTTKRNKIMGNQVTCGRGWIELMTSPRLFVSHTSICWSALRFATSILCKKNQSQASWIGGHNQKWRSSFLFLGLPWWVIYEWCCDAAEVK